jgi:hypothetical protein
MTPSTITTAETEASKLYLDTKYLVVAGSQTGYLLASLVAPPIYAGVLLTRYGRSSTSVSKLLRASWMGGLMGGALGGGISYARCSFSGPAYVTQQKQEVEYNVRMTLSCMNHVKVLNVLHRSLE